MKYEPTIIKFKTKCFGLVPEGEIVKGFLLMEGEHGSLLWFPPDTVGCGCLIWAMKDNDCYYEDANDDNWINLPESIIDPKFSEFLKTLKSSMLKIKSSNSKNRQNKK